MLNGCAAPGKTSLDDQDLGQLNTRYNVLLQSHDYGHFINVDTLLFNCLDMNKK